ncbi:methyltransferase 4 isoform X1 [Pelobates cultripes]|uniref:Methyltransferase 4 isoform X1 n=1 Tax=Pelobates cultripes TaxID=61616 RepID=A0AAD1W358_PELCU|nr:methyltransferase 4 isoform X1 [Pelobates cultripes]
MARTFAWKKTFEKVDKSGFFAACNQTPKTQTTLDDEQDGDDTLPLQDSPGSRDQPVTQEILQACLEEMTTKLLNNFNRSISDLRKDVQELGERTASMISDIILEGSLSLIREGLEKGFLHPLSEEEDKTELVTKLYPKTCGLAELCDMAKCMPLLNISDLAVHILNNENHFSQGTDFITHITENNSDWPQCIQLLGETYLIPPKSSFLMSDTTRIEPLLQYKKYHIIVIDPPWENKSVKRSKSYNYLSSVEIKQLPVPALAYPDCIVIIWVTNRQKHLRFVKEELFPHWSIKTLAEWHWVKITKSGELVFPLDSDHKKPYEILVLGRLQKNDNSIPREPTCNLTPIPQHKLIVSVPCKLHSHKPPLSEILKEYVKQDAECLELFARNLQPGWTCWGNEVLKFQHIDYFVPLET